MKVVNQQHRRIVEEAGGIYVPGMQGDLVLFNSRETGSTMGMTENELNVPAVRDHIAESNARFGVRKAA